MKQIEELIIIACHTKTKLRNSLKCMFPTDGLSKVLILRL